jgi:hypothetical protein
MASKRVRYPLTSRAMMSNSVNLGPRTGERFAPPQKSSAVELESKGAVSEHARSLLARLKSKDERPERSIEERR